VSLSLHTLLLLCSAEALLAYFSAQRSIKTSAGEFITWSKQFIGEYLYPLVLEILKSKVPDFEGKTAKLTGMLIENELIDLCPILYDVELLKARIDEGLLVLETAYG
jgi:hypothetical protein